MEMIRIYNNDDEMIEKTFVSYKVANEFEDILYFVNAHYERFSDGIKISENRGK
jgi:hypothetical protein